MTEIGFFQYCLFFPLNVDQVVYRRLFPQDIVSLKKEHIYNGISINTEMTNISRALSSNGFLVERLRAFFKKQYRNLASMQVYLFLQLAGS